MTFKPTSIPTKRLSTSVTASDTTFILNNIKGWDGNDLAASDFGTEGFGVLRDPTNSTVEFFAWDPSTIVNGATTGITITARGLQFDGDTSTEVTANQLTWVKGETIVELGSNPSQIWQWLKDYADGLAIAGAPDSSETAKGLVEAATQTEVDDGDNTGSTSAPTVVRPGTLRARKYHDYVLDTGSANAYVITPSPAISAYATGQVFVWKASVSNTAASTININSVGTKSIKRIDGADVSVGDIIAGYIYTIVYDGTNFVILSGLPSRNIRSVTAGATIGGGTLPVPVYQSKSDNEFYACDANDNTAYKFIGFAISDGTDGNSMTVQFGGVVSGFSSLDEGEKYYVQDTVGTIGTGSGTQEILVGIAISTTELLIQKGKRYASGTTTFSANTDQTITLGFRPSIVRIFAMGSDTDVRSYGGWTVGGGNNCIAHDGDSTPVTTIATTAWRAVNSAGNGQNGVVDNVTDTTFDLNVGQVSSFVSAILFWEAEGEL